MIGDPDEALDFAPVRALAHRWAGLSAEQLRSHLLVSRLRPLALRRGETLKQLVEAVRQPGAELRGAVVEALLTHETSFFRDAGPFDVLETVVLPKLIAARASRRRLRIWSAACSTGQEPYSLAMLLGSKFPELEDWHVEIVASDVGSAVLERARAGIFTGFEARRGLPPELCERWLVREGSGYRALAPLRRRVSFQQVNLGLPLPDLGAFDLVLLRNVLIYFDQAAKEAVLRRTASRLQPDGYLLLGGSETLAFVDSPFVAEQVAGTVWFRLATSCAQTQRNRP